MKLGLTRLLALIYILLIFISVFMPNQAYANQLTSRYVAISTSTVSSTTQHAFGFNYPSVSSIGSLKFEYCDNSPLIAVACSAPVGLDVSAAVLSSQSGEVGYTVDPLTNTNTIVLTRAPSLTAAVPATYTFTNVVNPSSASTVYVRVTTYATVDASGAYTDDGSLAFATITPVTTYGYVPPYLIFCVGVTVAGDCSSTSGQFLSFGELSELTPKYLTSQFAGATNDPGGFTTSVTGLTMTSGTNVIPALNVPTASIPGTSQFGMNLRANTNPAVGSDKSGVGTSVASADYNTPNQFTFKNQNVAQSTIPTNFNVFTVSYMVNISSSQNPGVYNTTLTYIAVAAF